MLEPDGSVAFSPSRLDLLLIALGASFGLVISAYYVRRAFKAKEHIVKIPGPAILGFILCLVLRVHLLKQVSVSDAGVDWTAVYWISWHRHQLQWRDVDDIKIRQAIKDAGAKGAL